MYFTHLVLFVPEYFKKDGQNYSVRQAFILLSPWLFIVYVLELFHSFYVTHHFPFYIPTPNNKIIPLIIQPIRNDAFTYNQFPYHIINYIVHLKGNLQTINYNEIHISGTMYKVAKIIHQTTPASLYRPIFVRQIWSNKLCYYTTTEFETQNHEKERKIKAYW